MYLKRRRSRTHAWLASRRASEAVACRAEERFGGQRPGEQPDHGVVEALVPGALRTPQGPSSPRIPVNVGGEEARRVELASNGSARQAQNRAAARKRSRHAPAIPARVSTGHLGFTQRITASLLFYSMR